MTSKRSHLHECLVFWANSSFQVSEFVWPGMISILFRLQGRIGGTLVPQGPEESPPPPTTSSTRSLLNQDLCLPTHTRLTLCHHSPHRFTSCDPTHPNPAVEVSCRCSCRGRNWAWCWACTSRPYSTSSACSCSCDSPGSSATQGRCRPSSWSSCAALQ